MKLEEGRQLATQLDKDDSLKHVRDEFLIPSKEDIASTRLDETGSNETRAERCVYLCGNSLGLQPKRTATRLKQYLSTWATQGVQGHFKALEQSPLPPWLHADDRAAELMAPIVGAKQCEVAVMQTLTANLHLLMSAFYRPDINGRHKILLESKAFPSDHIAVETQLRHHGLSPAVSMVEVTPSDLSSDNVISTEDIMSAISAHAETAALLLLPGIQYYTGQLLDVAAITAAAHEHGIFVVWDLAHAAGNVPLCLHEWDVDAAAWCTYKYLNGGPGCIGALFVHERHGASTAPADGEQTLPNRLAGWWGNDKTSRFAMDTQTGFRPAAGAAGFQLSNPSILDMTALTASLEVFATVDGGMATLRQKSLRLTAFLEQLLVGLPQATRATFRIITPPDPHQRGAQLSLKLAQGLLDHVMLHLAKQGVVVDERRPDVVRVAPAPLYNTFLDCVMFVQAFADALRTKDHVLSVQ